MIPSEAFCLNPSSFVRPLQRLWAVIAFMVVLLMAPLALAEGAIVVAEFDGAKPQGVRERVVAQLQNAGYDVVSDGDTPTVDPGAGDSHFAGVAAEGGYRAIIIGYTTMANSGWTTSLTVREGKTGAVVGKASIKAGWYPGLVKALDKSVVPRLEGPLDKAEGPAGRTVSEEPKPVDKSDREDGDDAPAVDEREDEQEEEEDGEEAYDDRVEDEETSVESDDDSDDSERLRDKGKREDPALELDAGGFFIQRQWEVIDPVAGPGNGPILATHDVPLFGAQVELGLYPMAFFDDESFLRNIGITVAYLRSYKARSEFPDTPGLERSTLFEELDLGGRVRIPISKTMRAGVVGGGGAQALSVGGENATTPHPDPLYDYWYAGADFDMAVAKMFTFEVGASYRGLLGLGEAYGQLQAPEWFPSGTGFGILAYADAIYWFHEMVGARLGLHLMLYALDFQPDLDSLAEARAAGDPAPPVAGGATDMYWGVDLSVVLAVY